MPFGSEGVQDGVGLALSGGGFRATLFHAGALWRLNELRWLPRLDRVSSVSGGSIATAVLAKAWPALEFRDNVATRFREAVVEPILKFTKRNVDTPSIVKGALTPGRSIAEVMVAQYRNQLLGDFRLQQLPDRPLFVFVATNLGTGAMWRFGKPYSGDYRLGLIHGYDCDVATAVAASAAFPPVLSPVVLRLDPDRFTQTKGADLFDHRELRKVVALADGGVYDNMGVQPIWDRYRTLLVSDAGGPASMQFGPKRMWWNQLHRAYGLTIEQDRDLRRRILYKAFTSHDPKEKRSGTYWLIAWPMEKFNTEHALLVAKDWPRTLSEIPTRLTRFTDEEQQRLINWGYALTDAAIRRRVEPSDVPTQWPFADYRLDA